MPRHADRRCFMNSFFHGCLLFQWFCSLQIRQRSLTKGKLRIQFQYVFLLWPFRLQEQQSFRRSHHLINPPKIKRKSSRESFFFTTEAYKLSRLFFTFTLLQTEDSFYTIISQCCRFWASKELLKLGNLTSPWPRPRPCIQCTLFGTSLSLGFPLESVSISQTLHLRQRN